VRRRDVIKSIGGFLVALPYAAHAEERAGIRRIGILSGATREAMIGSGPWAGFRQGMREHGYTEGKNLVIEWRFAQGNYQVIPQLANELIAARVEVIVLGTPTAVKPVQNATKTIPIVMGYSVDPVGSGLVASLSHPGGNTTGLASSLEESVSKQIELIAEVIPGLPRIGILHNPGNPLNAAIEKAKTAALAANAPLRIAQAKNADELEKAFQTLSDERVGGVIVLSDAFFNSQSRHIAQLGIQHRIPTIFPQREYVVYGGLMSYGENLSEFFRRAAYYVDKLLRGAKPAELPVEQPTQFLLVINLKTAELIGLTIPAAVLSRADEVIE
jgi:putative ABC transport system substrate-binding protein